MKKIFLFILSALLATASVAQAPRYGSTQNTPYNNAGKMPYVYVDYAVYTATVNIQPNAWQTKLKLLANTGNQTINVDTTYCKPGDQMLLEIYSDSVQHTITTNYGLDLSDFFPSGTFRFTNFVILLFFDNGQFRSTSNFGAAGNPPGTFWRTTGDNGTVAGTNFAGTIDSIDYVIKTENTEWMRMSAAGKLLIGQSTGNSTVVIKAMDSTVAASAITVLSSQATGTDTIFNVYDNGNIGVGNFNTANCVVGILAARNVSNALTGQNTVFGSSSARSLVGGLQNVSVGYHALDLNVSGHENTATGVYALGNITSTNNNTGDGYFAGYGFAAGSTRNIAVGAYAAGSSGGNVSAGGIAIGFSSAGLSYGTDYIAIGDYAGTAWNYTSGNTNISGNIYIGTAAYTGANEFVIAGVNVTNQTSVANVFFNGRFSQVANLSPLTIGNVNVTDSARSSTAVATSVFGAKVTNGSAATAPITIRGSAGTGTGIGGDIIFSTAPPTSPSAASNPQVEAMRVTYNGQVGIGISPTAVLMLKAGTTVASTAPLKFTTGALNTTAEVGAKEYNNAHYETNNALNRYASGGAIKDFIADENNSGTGETDAYSYTTKANTFAADGEKITFTYTVNLSDVTATAQIKVWFAGNTIGNTGALTVSATGAVVISGWIIRTSSTTVRTSINISSPGASTAVYTSENDLTALTLSGTNILKLTLQSGGAGGGSNDITAKLGTISWIGAANN